jgi:hypothetical protein
VDSEGRTIFVVDAHRGDGKRFVVRADEKLTAFIKLESDPPYSVPPPIIPRLKEILANPDPALGYLNGELRFFLGWAQEVVGDHAAAQETWQQARSELESFLKEQPESFILIGWLSFVLFIFRRERNQIKTWLG